MHANNLKIGLSAACVVGILAIIPMIGLTVDSVDEKEGVMIDFGYYDVDWVPITFSDGMTGIDALKDACHVKGYEYRVDRLGKVTSVNGESDLVSATWGMYVLGDQGHWVQVPDPVSFEVSGQKIVSWARTSDVDAMMPAVDDTGFTYYSYADGGKDLMGNDLRLITLAPSVTETVASIGGEQYIVATDKYSDYPKSLVEKQNSGDISFVGGYTDPNYELIVSQKPDIVFLDGSVGEHLTMADKLRKSGVHCVMLYEVVTVDDLLKNVWIAASAIGLSVNGNEYIKSLSSTISSICAVTNIHAMKAFISLSTTESPYVAGDGTYADSILDALGVTNIFEDQYSWVMVDKEVIWMKQPDFIVIVYQDGIIDSQKEYDDLLRSLSSMWKDTPAFKNKDIVIFSGDSADLLSRPGVRLGAAFELLAKALDPQSFIDRDYWDRAPGYYGDDYSQYLKYQQGGLMV